MTEAQIEQTVQTEAKAGLSWLQKHERILIVAMVLISGSWLGNHYLNTAADADKQKVVVAEQVLADQVTKNAQLAAQSQQAAAQYQATISAITQQNAQLAAAMASRTVVLQQQQAVDKTLPMPDLGNRWAQLAGLQPGDLNATTAGITVSPDAARTTVSKLEQVPVLEANLKDTQTQVKNGQDGLDKANILIGDQGKQITGLNTQIVDQSKACDAKVTSVKADANKSKLNWFLRGLAIGGVAAAYVAIHII